MGHTGQTATAKSKTERIPSGHVTLEGELSVPVGARGVVLFAHGSGSSRHSKRNQFVARTDLAGEALSGVRSPTLLIVGGLDYTVIRLNQEAYAQLRSEKKLVIVPGATHLFEEPGTLEEVASLAANWFQRHLGANSAA